MLKNGPAAVPGTDVAHSHGHPRTAAPRLAGTPRRGAPGCARRPEAG